MKTQLLKKLSLLLCVCLLLSLFGCANGNASTGQQAAGDKTIQPPFAGVKWGMTVEQVQQALGENYTFTPSGDGLYVLENYDKSVFDTELGISQAYSSRNKLTENTNTAVNFYFTKAISYNGIQIAPVLSGITFTLKNDDFERTVKNVEKSCGFSACEGKTEEMNLGQVKGTQTSYYIWNGKTAKDADPVLFSLSYAMYQASQSQSENTAEKYVTDETQASEILQSMYNRVADDEGRVNFYPTLVFVQQVAKEGNDDVPYRIEVVLKANYSVYDDIAAQYAGK